MKDLEILLKRLKDIKDYWVKTTLDGFDSKTDMVWSECENEYICLRSLLVSNESKRAYEKIVDETIRGVIHSILVMVDGGDELTDMIKIDLINADTKKPLKECIALHEEFLSYLFDEE